MAAVEPRYAEALLSATQNRHQAEEIGKVIEDFSCLMQTSSELHFFMLNPVIPIIAKKNVITQIIPSNVSVYALNFLQLLVDKNRLANLDGIVKEYNQKMALQNGVLIVKVTSSEPLSQRELDEISSTYRKKHVADEVKIEATVNPELLGGIKVQIGDNLTDDSLYGRLKALATALGQ